MPSVGLAATGVLVLLALLALIQLRRRLLRGGRKPRLQRAEVQVTPAGIALTVFLVGLLLLGYAQMYLAPESEFGQLVSAVPGRVFYAVAVATVGTVFGMVLELIGLPPLRNRDKR